MLAQRGAAAAGMGYVSFKCRTLLGASWTNNMFKKILVANRGVLAAGKAKQIALARASVRAMSRENAHV